MTRNVVRTLAALAVVFCAVTAQAITHIWSGGNMFGPDSMSNPLNWSGGVPVDGSSNLTLIFPNGAGSFNPNQNIASPLDLQSLQVTGGFYSFAGNGYAFENLGAAPTLSVNGGAFFNAPVAFLDPTAGSIVNNLTFNGLLSGGGDLTLTTSSNASLGIQGAGSNTYTGTLTINSNVQGSFNKPGGFAIQGDLVIDGSNAYVNASAPNQLGPNTDLFVTNNGYFQTFFGNPQSVRDVRADNNGQVVMNNSVLTVTGTMSSNAGFGTITNNFADTIDLAGGLRNIDVQSTGPFETLSIVGKLTNGRINKIGPGEVQMFNGGNTFTGQNIVTAGTIYGSPNSIGTNVLNNGTVKLNSGSLNSSIISGTGNVIIVGSVNYNAAQSYGGGTTIQDAFSSANGDTNTLVGNFNSAGFGTLRFNQTFNGTFTGSLSGSLFVMKEGVGVVTLGGVNTHTAATQLQGGGLKLTTDTAIGSGTLQIQAGADPNSIEAVGTRTYANQLVLGYNLSVVGSGNFNFTDTTAKVFNNNLVHSSTGSTTIAGKFTLGPSATIVVNSGTLALGNAALVGGFTASGSVTVNGGGTLTVNSFNFTTLPDVTLAGGTLNAPNGYAIPLGAALQGNGGVTGRVASANGSTILASGNLTLGDGSHVAGVNLDGELYTGTNIVTLQDANQAVLGSLTDIGSPSVNGTLASSNGYVLNFGRNIVGRGQIQSNNTLADAAIINGDVNGDSIVNYLEFTGYVKGVGTFNNVAFSGTFSPGLSPTLMTVGNIIYTPSNVLDMELGGLGRGGQYDAFDITNGSTMVLNGQLKISLINAFNPSLGDQFLLFQGLGSGTTAGAFSSFNFPMLDPGLAWDTSLLYSNGLLRVVNGVPEPASLVFVGMLIFGLLPRRSGSVRMDTRSPN